MSSRRSESSPLIGQSHRCVEPVASAPASLERQMSLCVCVPACLSLASRCFLSCACSFKSRLDRQRGLRRQSSFSLPVLLFGFFFFFWLRNSCPCHEFLIARCRRFLSSPRPGKESAELAEEAVVASWVVASVLGKAALSASRKVISVNPNTMQCAMNYQ